MRPLALLLALLVACGGTKPRVAAPDEDEDDDEVAEHDNTIEPIIAAPPPPLDATEDDLVAALERGPCHGTCATYNVSVYRTGELRYEGRWGVRTVGIVVDRVTPAQIVKLEELFAEHDFATLAGEYTEAAVLHHPTVTTWYRAPDGELLATVHDHGIGDDVVSQELAEIEDSVDRIVEIERWIGTEDERSRLRGR